MIITEYIEVDVNRGNVGSLRKHYPNAVIGDKIKIPPLLFKGSERKVIAKCYYCAKEKEVVIKNYVNATKKLDRYCCDDTTCMQSKREDLVSLGVNTPDEKRKATNLERYGTEHVFASEEVIKKIRNTVKERFGVEHASQNKDIKAKVRQTKMERYPEMFIKKEKPKRVYIPKPKKERPKKEKPFKKGICWVKERPKSYSEIVVDLRTSNQKRIDTTMERYGVSHVSQDKSFRDKASKTNKKRYGYANPLSSPEIQKKIKDVMIERYGVDHNSKSPELRKSFEKTMMDRYGVLNPMQIPESVVKTKETNIKRFGKEHPLQSDIYRTKKMKIAKHEDYIGYCEEEKLNYFYCESGDHMFEINSTFFNGRDRIGTPLCTICNPKSDSSSIKEKDMCEFILQNTDLEVISGYRDELEIDVYIPSLKLGFEFNGLFWHSEDYRENNYHINKTNFFKDRGIKIIHIWEDEWINKRDIIESQILNLIGKSTKIFGRKTKVEKIDNKIARSFLEDNHLQGSYNGIIKSYGLYRGEELLSVMTFDNLEGRSKMDNNSWNLSRFCNKLNTTVVGGASKLFKAFLKDNSPNRVISYADLDWSSGELYNTLGFKEKYRTRPDYKYVVSGQRRHKSGFRKKKGEIRTERQIMQDKGIKRIYDCGKIKFEYIQK